MPEKIKTDKLHVVSSETPSTPEKRQRYDIKFNILALAGYPGAGNTTTIDDLTELLGGTVQTLKAGTLVRKHYTHVKSRASKENPLAEEHEGGTEIVGPVQRTPKNDRAIDKLMELKLLANIKEDIPSLIEAKRSALISMAVEKKIIEDGGQAPVIVRLLLTCDEEASTPRIWERQVKKKPSMTLEEAGSETSKRRVRDMQQWAAAAETYPGFYYEIDPLNPTTKIYNLIIDTSQHKLHETAPLILGWLIKERFVVPKNGEKPEDKNLP